MLSKPNIAVTKNKIAAILFVILLISANQKLFSQEKYDKDFYGGLFYITDFICSPEFESLKQNNTDLELVDTLFYRALNFFDGDVSEACLCLTFSTIPFHNIKIKTPIIHNQFIIPLPSPGLKVFTKRTENLPKNLLIDSPKNDFGDKDKLAHFFGNAFIGNNFGWFNLSKFMGIFVENVEATLFVEGSYDRRDLMINRLGEFFGRMIKNKPDLKPSNVLEIYQLQYLRLY